MLVSLAWNANFSHFCNTLPVPHKKSENCSVMIWGCFSWSGLGTARVPECTEWPGYPSNGFFLPWRLGHIAGQQCQDSSGSSCERVEHEDTWVPQSMRSHFHTLATVLTLTPLKVFGVQGKDWMNGVDSPVINTKSRPKMNATLKGNKCCDVASGCRNNATEKCALQPKQKAVFCKRRVWLFFGTGSAFYTRLPNKAFSQTC